MNYSKDYENIRTIIDEIVGVDTQQGNNLKMAIKKYFELKLKDIKLVSHNKVNYNNETTYAIAMQDTDMDTAMKTYNEKIKSSIQDLRDKGKYIGTIT